MSYKNILWIDDFNINDADGFSDTFLEDEQKEENNEDDERNKQIIKDYFGQWSDDVKLIKNYKEALTKLEKNNEKYDLVVFDIDMNNGMDINDFSDIENILNSKRVLLVLKKGFEEFQKTAGLYLYLFLLNCGYPSERMIILTGNGNDSKDLLKKVYIHDEDIRGCSIIKEKDTVRFSNNKDKWLVPYYEDEYYKVRRLVYKACEYWKEKLEELKESPTPKSKISFNQLYFENKLLDESEQGNYNEIEESSIEPDSFINMLEKIELLFPVSKPQEPEKLYYHALQVVSMFHEESADIKKIKILPEIKKYHQSIRNFRNWSAHNKFEKIEIKAGLFMCFFCMALRTYFVNTEEDMLYEKDFNEFVDEFTKSREKNINIDVFKGKYEENWKRHLERVCNQDMNKNKNKKGAWECNSIDELLRASGNCENKEMKLEDSVLNLFDCLKRKLEPIRSNYDSEKNTVSYEVTYKWNTENFQNEEQNELNYFRKCAIYYLLQS